VAAQLAGVEAGVADEAGQPADQPRVVNQRGDGGGDAGLQRVVVANGDGRSRVVAVVDQ
jgi:hypothetical protein